MPKTILVAFIFGWFMCGVMFGHGDFGFAACMAMLMTLVSFLGRPDVG